jgi:hypothetical protein
MDMFIYYVMQSKVEMADYVQQKIEQRVERGVGNRSHLVSFVLKNNDEGKGVSERRL